jgi:hypothetical protein
MVNVKYEGDELGSRFLAGLEMAISAMNEDTSPNVRAFLSTIRQTYPRRVELVGGLSGEFLVMDLIGILSSLESRISALERREGLMHE